MRKQTQVIIIGAGPVGVAMALELALQGVHSILIEEHVEPQQLPKATQINPRSAEYFRRWGIIDSLKQACPLGEDYARATVWAQGIHGPLIARIALVAETIDANYCPENFMFLPQWLTESVLREKAQQSDFITTYFGYKATTIEQDDNKVSVTLENIQTQQQQTIEAHYAIGCDGANSFTRNTLNYDCDIDALKGKLAAKLLFKSTQLTNTLSLPEGHIYYLMCHDEFAALGPVDGKTVWYSYLTNVDADKINDDYYSQKLYRACNAEFDCDIINSQTWQMQTTIANDFRKQRVFLAGDAAHIIPPTGGHGLNTGFCDVVNLGWKIKLALQNPDYDHLLDSYSQERRPIAIRNMRISEKNGLEMVGLMKQFPPAEDSKGFAKAITALAKQHGRIWGVVYGYRYQDSPWVIADDKPDSDDKPDQYIACAAPGHILPHIWLSENVSIHDKIKQQFVLFCSDDNFKTASEFSEKNNSNISLQVESVPDEYMRDAVQAKFIVARPDHHVYWRGDDLEQLRFLLS